MKTYILLIAAFFVVSTRLNAQTWILTWSDEFEYNGLPDATKWAYEEGKIRNKESQYYTRERKENARVENGALVIEARDEDYNGAEHTSASLITQGKMEFLYGRIEVRAKLPGGVGMWPAIWMLGTNRDKGWPARGEIDIMENVGYDPDTIHANIHTQAYNHAIGTNKGSGIYVESPSEDFHIYAVEWFEDHMDFFVDGQKYFTFKNEQTGNDTWPFDQPHYLILNIAVGGAWGGKHGIDEHIFPQQMLVDYVRYYQQQ
ncbi:MAG: glycoside hydrolase family 16 protein [Cyclobacteriaceae bacterium]|nr:glycoside hydrolase family 16 protein [Cyclobacteriaceae bacterium]